MASFFARHGAGEILARYSFIEPLLAGRRVLELGAAAATEGASALLLAERGAAAVLSLVESGPELEAARAAGHHPFVRFDDAPLESLPAGAFDLILLADGAPLADDPGRITALRRLLAEKGHLITAIPAASGRSLAELAGDATPVQSPAYEAFIGALTEHFPWVEVATQSATVGYIIAVPPPEGEEAEVSIDGSQAGDADAAAYVALCGEGPTGLAGITMVALPARQLLDDASASRQVAVAGAAQAGGAVAALQGRVAELTAASEAAGEELARLGQECAALTADRDRLLAERRLAAEEREGLLQDREAAMSGEAEARAALERVEQGGQAGGQTLEKLRSVEALCDAEREAGAAARADAERLGGLLGLRDRELGELRAQQESLRQRLAEAELEAARLGEERTRAVVELAGRSSAGEESEAGLRAARAEAQAARSVLEGSLARADAAEVRVQELEEGLEQRVSELSALRAEVAGATDLRTALGSRAEAAEAALLTARGELDRLREESVTARGEAEVALREIDEARGEAARATSVLAELRVELRATAEALEETRGQLEAAKGAPPGPSAAAPVLEAGKAERAAEAERLAEEMARLAGERDGLAAQLDQDHRKADLEREQLVGQLDEARAIIQGAADRLREMEAQRTSAEADARLQRERAAEAVARARDAEAAAEAARAEAARTAPDGAPSSAALAEALRAAEEAEGQAAGIDAELQAVRWEKEEIEQRLASLQQLDRQAAMDRSDAVSASMEAARLRAEMEPLRKELAQLRGGGEARDLEVEGLRGELARVQAELAERATAPVPDAGRTQQASAENEQLAAAIADRDLKIGRLQREVTDKTERLGRLAAEIGELKARGIGKIFR